MRVSASPGAAVRYEVFREGKPLIEASDLGLEFADGSAVGVASEIRTVTPQDRDSTWENSFGKRRVGRDHHRELVLDLREGAPGSTAPVEWKLVVRAYDAGVAFRYIVRAPAGGDTSCVVKDERTQFVFPSDHRAWWGSPSNCAESQYEAAKLSSLPRRADRAGVMPLLVETPAAWVSVAEADLRNWAGAFVERASDNDHAARLRLAQRPDGRGAVVIDGERASPWRVVMIGRTPADLMESDLILNLSAPSRIADTSWIKPGIAAWDAWFAGPLAPSATTETHKRYIDFAAEMGWSYQIVDWGWYGPHDSPEADVTRWVEPVDIPAVLAHARERGIRIFLWVHSADLNRTGIEKTLATFAAWGVAGVKIDFMDREDQEMVQWYERALETAARHRLLVNFHGAYKPTGLARTWPNFITQEGVLGNEYNKLKRGGCTIAHTLMLPFTRGLLGPMDFTPGGFHNRWPAEFETGARPPHVMGTRARQLAMAVVYESPLLVMCDAPESYRGQPGIEFFRGLPTVWDETRVLGAELGEHVAVARRSGDRWYLGALAGERAVTLELPVQFLAEGNWEMERYGDAQNPKADATEVEIARETLRRGQPVRIRMAPGGGFAAVLTKSRSAEPASAPILSPEK